MTEQFKERLNKEEQLELLKIMKSTPKEKDEYVKARLKLMEHNLLYVWEISEEFVEVFEHEELLSIGTIGLIMGIDEFDFKEQTDFESYIKTRIINEILNAIENEKQGEIDQDEHICIR